MQILSRIACLGAAAFLVAPGASAEQTPLTFQAFSLSNFQQSTEEANPTHFPTQLTPLSDAAGVTRIGLDSFANMATTYSGGITPAYSIYQLTMQLHAVAGYKITGFAFSGDLAGVLEPAQAPDGYPYGHVGTANNRAWANLGAFAAGAQQDYAGAEVHDVAGAGQIVFHSNGTFLPDNMSLEFNAGVNAHTDAGYFYDFEGNERKVPSFSSLRLLNPVLTIYSAALPVPEPDTWMMLLAGLALPWAAARRAKKRGQAAV